MQLLSTWSEGAAHTVRSLLLAGWLLLIATLVVPGLDPWPVDVNTCGPIQSCHSHQGNQIFWGVVVPTGILILVLLSHELWRRICPLAFVSQTFRALGLQRTVAGRNGRREVVRVEPTSWLGRHHVQLQWGLFVAGLSLRVLLLNSHTVALAVFLVLTLVAALAMGWAYGGKAWCQYICPMAPVQTVLTGPRSLLGSPAHLQTGSRITQSMCRTVDASGKVQSACVACQAPCIDIDSERTYWQSLSGKRGLAWAWGSYPGLVIAFFLLVETSSREGVDALRSGLWAYDTEPIHRLLTPLGDGRWTLHLPRLLTIPALLLLAGWLSVQLFQALRGWLLRQLSTLPPERAQELATQRSRLLASFAGVNAFFFFADPSLGVAGPLGGQLIRSLVLVVSGMWLHRGWRRERATYIRESTSTSLRKQLERLVPDLARYLDGRAIGELSSEEVFTLARVLPAHMSDTNRRIYREVLADLFSSGRLERAASLVQLDELRLSLGLVEEDHHAALRELAIEDPRILQLNPQQLEIRFLRQAAAAEAIDELLLLTGAADLAELAARPAWRDQLERIRRTHHLDDACWQKLQARFGPSSEQSRRRLQQWIESLTAQIAARRSLAQAAAEEPMIRPLLPTIDRQLTSLLVTMAPALRALEEPALAAAGDAEPQEPLRLQTAALLPLLPESLIAQVRLRDLPLPAPRLDLAAERIACLPDPLAVLEGLWQDPDPDTALWVLWLLDRLAPERGQALRQVPRLGPSNATLDRLLRYEPLPELRSVVQLLRAPLVADLSPAALLSMLRLGDLRTLEPGAVLFELGDQADTVTILLEGSCEVLRPDGAAASDAPSLRRVALLRPGEPIGEVAYFADHCRRSTVRVAEEPVRAMVFRSTQFEQLLLQSPEFSRGLLRQLSVKIDDLYSLAARRPLALADGATAGGAANGAAAG
ncbi:MAG: cyclic nucleotide-binding domain-containing protein [Cyanobacteria bacterium K_Offshore_surface_m2_011]|nr:cyclic nucleotide-binding domain-containing protein [Cyanobacteria bacterium K_Offshore_surface_m2_011]